LSGAVSATNILVGSQTDDQVGNSGVRALACGMAVRGARRLAKWLSGLADAAAQCPVAIGRGAVGAGPRELPHQRSDLRRQAGYGTICWLRVSIASFIASSD